jgi:hypothetical protein
LDGFLEKGSLRTGVVLRTESDDRDGAEEEKGDRVGVVLHLLDHVEATSRHDTSLAATVMSAAHRPRVASKVELVVAVASRTGAEEQ